MLFTQIEFLLFFIFCLISIYLTSSNRFRKGILLFASYYFYAYWDWRFLSLIIYSTLIDFIVGKYIARTKNQQVRKRLLFISLVSNLSVLGFFKYFNFFINSLSIPLAEIGLNVTTLNIILPIGISFYTFQTLSYTIDIYRNKIPPTSSILDFSLFVAFFPQIVAGPIVRAAEFLPQLKVKRVINWDNLFIGFRLFTFGFFKKVFIADNLAIFVDKVFENPSVFSSITILLGVIAFGIQIYCDFSGYSDMAIGIAKALGYELPLNFNYPYIAKNITDFWRRWHMSLSFWLRDYLYIPLGGNRKGTRRTYINLMLTMLLGGLWHGASWNFVVWGGLHGIALAFHKLISNRSFLKNAKTPLIIYSFLSRLITLFLVFVLWVIFRSSDFGLNQAMMIFKQLVNFNSDLILWIHPFVIIAFIFIWLTHILAIKNIQIDELLKSDKLYTPIVLFTMWWLIILYYPSVLNPFIYFQF